MEDENSSETHNFLSFHMSTYILMKILESTPSRYDRGIRILTLGRLDEVYDRLISYVRSGQNVLDIGCGTGALTLRAAQKGAKVKGIDVNPQMLEIAKKRAEEAELTQNVELHEMGVGELGSEKSENYDAIMSGLCFSELTEDELLYTLNEVERILKIGGLLLIADEAKPINILRRIFNWLLRFPLVVVTFLISQTSTRAIKNLPEKINNAGLIIEFVRLNKMKNFIEVVARKPK